MSPDVRINFYVKGKNVNRKHHIKIFFKETLILLETSFVGASVLIEALGLHWAAGPAPSGSVLFSFCNLGIFCCSKYN